ncbi:MAG: SufD family Fe-S cluster assembly protein [Gammaproteobacteria bacterium]|nr:SufD family Fe-S cluster assembly protein [Gammaproteobacteria bacterium]MYI77673.1 SufD family Fe-S cluster assembly protein [Gammaproteobacteria bacterium]
MTSQPVKIAPWLDAKQIEQTIENTRLPQQRKDPWKYTSVKQVLQRLDSPFEKTDQLPNHNGSGVLVGDFGTPMISSLARKYVNQIANNSNNVLPSLNLLRAQHGYAIVSNESNDSVRPAVQIPASDSCERILIVVQEQANLEIMEHTSGGNRVIECLILPGGQLVHRRIQPTTTHVEYNSLTVNVMENSSYQMMQYSVGAQLRRNDIVINIEGEGATVDVSGGWKLSDISHLDTQLAVNHRAKGSTSQQKFHGVVGDSARAVFNGRIYIARNAPKTDAHLQNKNIATSDGAAIFTKPELEIYADDVVCSHGATSGQLDEQQIFYLRTRGIPDDRSRELILEGFLAEIVEHEEGASVLGIQPRKVDAP